jgi:hypothetical protein
MYINMMHIIWYYNILYIIIYYMCVLEDLKQLHFEEFSTRCVLWLCCQVAESTEARLEVFRMETELKIIWHSGNMWKLEISLHTLAYFGILCGKLRKSRIHSSFGFDIMLPQCLANFAKTKTYQQHLGTTYADRITVRRGRYAPLWPYGV